MAGSVRPVVDDAEGDTGPLEGDEGVGFFEDVADGVAAVGFGGFAVEVAGGGFVAAV